MGFLAQNLAILTKSQPVLAETLANAASLSSHTADAPDGGKSVRLYGADGPWVQSRRAPVQEAERMVAGVTLKHQQPCVILGLGMGYAVDLLLKKYPESTVIALETELPLIKLVLDLHDFTDALGSGRLGFAMNLKGQPVVDVYAIFGDEMALNGFGTLSHGYTANVKAYLDLYSDLAKWARQHSLTMRTTMHGHKQSILNLMFNIPYYLISPGIDAFRGALKGLPGVLCGAGPSLERNIREIKKYQGKVYVHAVSSALKRVSAEGIKVHSTNVVDYSHLSQRYFSGIEGDAPPLWAEPRTNPRVLDTYKGPLILSDDGILRGIFREDVPEHGMFSGGGNNVAHYGFHVLTLLGCDPIILCGLDQAFSFHTTHIPGTAIHDEWVTSAHRFCNLETQELSFLAATRHDVEAREDVYGNPVYSDALMESSAQVFETFFGRGATMKVINATEGGRILKGADNMALKDALARHATVDIDFSPYYAALDSTRGEREHLLGRGFDVLNKARKFGDTLEDVFRDAKRALNKAEKSLIRREAPKATEKILDDLNLKLNEWRGIYRIVINYAPADLHVRQKLDAVLADTSIPELERLRILARRERNFINALERALAIWHEALDRSIVRMRDFIAGRPAKLEETPV